MWLSWHLLCVESISESLYSSPCCSFYSSRTQLCIASWHAWPCAHILALIGPGYADMWACVMWCKIDKEGCVSVYCVCVCVCVCVWRGALCVFLFALYVRACVCVFSPSKASPRWSRMTRCVSRCLGNAPVCRSVDRLAEGNWHNIMAASVISLNACTPQSAFTNALLTMFHINVALRLK